MGKVVVADASCLIVLEKIGELDLLKKIFSVVTITPEVKREFGLPLPEWIKLEEAKDKNRVTTLRLLLDEGEASSIALCLEQEAPLLIVDEKKGRAIAKELDLHIIGTLGILLEAKRMGVVKELRPVLDKIVATDFRIAPTLFAKILQDEE